jgi:hypothetical protein
MKKNILFALPLSALALACAQDGLECETVTMDSCQGNPDSPMDININVASGLTVAPPNICTRAGKVIDIIVTPATSSETVETIPKDPAHTWMAANNSGPGPFEIRVPDELPDGRYDYGVETGSGHCLDPRFTVN